MDRNGLPSIIREEYEKMLSLFTDKNRIEDFNRLVLLVETKTNYLESPASTKYHESCKHGLLLHSLSVTSLMFDFRNAVPIYSDISDSSIVLTGMFHDLGKVGVLDLKNNQYYPMYLPCEATEKQKAAGFGPSQPYKFNDKLPVYFEHCDLSLWWLQFAKMVLTPDEQQAIRTHDGEGKEANKEYLFKTCKLADLLHIADSQSAKWAEM